MKHTISAAIAAFAMLVGPIFVSPVLAQLVTPEMFGALPNVSEAKLSPDGNSAALLQNIGDSSAVVFYDLANPGAPPTGIGLGGSKARDMKWADDDHLLLLVSQTNKINTNTGLQTREFWRWVSVSKSKSKATILFGNESGYFVLSSGELLATVPADKKHAVFARVSQAGRATGATGPSRMKRDNDFAYTLFSVNLDNGNAKRISVGKDDTRDWVVDRNGSPIARIDYDKGRRERKIFVSEGGSARLKLLSSFPEEKGERAAISFYGPSQTPGKLYATLRGDNGKRSLVEFDLATGETGPPLFDDGTHDISSVMYDATVATATGVRFISDIPRSFHFDSVYQNHQKNLAKALPGAAPAIVSKSADGSKMIVEAYYTDHPRQYFIYEPEAKKLAMLSPSYRALDGKVFARKEKFDYTTSDGLLIRGFLTVPKGANKTSMPLIVLPHGGPASRDDLGFEYWPFFYAARGYLVYQPNFRGSSGYGAAFEEAGHGEWGRKMQDDITDGVKKLIADGIVDPARICIVGASYGGYAALAGATLTPGLYKCAVSVNGVSNLPGMLGAEARSSEFSGEYWERLIGSRFHDLAELNAVSPSKIADKAGPPILLIHGRDDTVVPIAQSRQMRGALKAASKEYEYVELDGEDHWLSNGKTRTEMLARSIEFIDQYIGQ